MSRLLGKAAIIVAILVASLTTSQIFAQTTRDDGKKLELSISKDGRAIVDQNGKVIARFAKGLRVKATTKGTNAKLQGCFRCENECVIYDGNRCVQYIRSCTWDFDC